MEWKRILETQKGLGVLATADGEGKVDAAVYGRPHILSEDRVAFIMADRLSHHHLQSNPHAAYLFRANPQGDGPRYEGVRLFLTRVEEDSDPGKIQGFQRRKYSDPSKTRFLVTFRVDKVLPLIGAGDDGEDPPDS